MGIDYDATSWNPKCWPKDLVDTPITFTEVNPTTLAEFKESVHTHLAGLEMAVDDGDMTEADWAEIWALFQSDARPDPDPPSATEH